MNSWRKYWKQAAAVVLAVLFSLTLCRAQDEERVRTLPQEIPHLQFMGTPIDGSPLPFIETLKDRGFSFIEQKGSVFILTGTFSGVPGCALGVNTKENFIWKVSVSFPTQPSWSAVKARYEKYKNSYIEKYQVKPESVEKLSPRFREGTGQEHWGFEDESSQWQSTFNVPDGFIILAIKYNRSQSNMFLVVEYVDKVNFLMKEQIDMEDI